MDQPELRPRRRRLATIASEPLTPTHREPPAPAAPTPRDTLRGILVVVCVVLTLGGAVFAAGSARGWTPEERLRKEIPWCPEAGTYSWSVEISKRFPERVAYAEQLFLERNWTHVESKSLGHFEMMANIRDFHTTITARCIPGTYDPSSGRIMEAPR